MATGGEDSFMSDEIVLNACCVCAKKGRKREGDSYCVECTNYYCSSCLDIHSVVPSMENHQILGASHFKTSSGTLPSYPTLRCNRHPSKIVDLYCSEHAEVACASCIALDHRSCKNLKVIADDIDGIYRTSKAPDVKTNFRSLKSALSESQKERDDTLKDLEGKVDLAVNEIQTFTKKLQMYIEVAANETITELKKEYTRIEASIKQEILEIKSLQYTSDILIAELERNEGNKAQEFVCVKTFEKLSARGKNFTETLQTQVTCDTVSFTADRHLERYLKQLDGLGEISTIQTSDFKPTITDQIVSANANVKHRLPNASCPKSGLSGCTVKQQRDVNVKIPSDERDCYIFGSCLAGDGHLLLTDLNIMKMKRLDLDKEIVVDYITFDALPYAISQVDRTEVIVSFSNKTIQVISVKNSMDVRRTLTFDHTCVGLFHHSGKLFISDGGKKVYIYDMQGQKLQRISIAAFGEDIFGVTRHIAVSNAEHKVYVADEQTGLVILDIGGNHLSTLLNADKQISQVWGVCTHGGNVFVCGLSSNNVIQIGNKNAYVKQIAEVSAPTSLCVDPQRFKLYVTRRDNYITVLALT